MHCNLSQPWCGYAVWGKNGTKQNGWNTRRQRHVARHLANMQKSTRAPGLGTNLCEPGQSKCTAIQIFMIFTDWKMLRRRISPERKHTLQHFTRTFFIQKFTGKIPCPTISPEHGHTVGASLRDRHAGQHVYEPRFTDIYSCRQEPRPRPCASLQSRTGSQLHKTLYFWIFYGNNAFKKWSTFIEHRIYSYSTDPSVWTYVWGRNVAKMIRQKPWKAHRSNQSRSQFVTISMSSSLLNITCSAKMARPAKAQNPMASKEELILLDTWRSASENTQQDYTNLYM